MSPCHGEYYPTRYLNDPHGGEWEAGHLVWRPRKGKGQRGAGGGGGGGRRGVPSAIDDGQKAILAAAAGDGDQVGSGIYLSFTPEWYKGVGRVINPGDDYGLFTSWMAATVVPIPGLNEGDYRFLSSYSESEIHYMDLPAAAPVTATTSAD
ncbi:hypothetical protein BJY01DRAFT_256033 [Aspergillus pseudoustus]|uniref:Uncharacterized protein n=1 Tax=Aspergillus pseudoustus TaxID=1810923 RepID=A0ABR4IEZ5_9EURO